MTVKAEKIRYSVMRRVTGALPAINVPQIMQSIIDHVIDIFADECFTLYPRARDPMVEEVRHWERLSFYRDKVLSAVRREYRTAALDDLLMGRTLSVGAAAMQFHQYIAALKRGAYNHEHEHELETAAA